MVDILAPEQQTKRELVNAARYTKPDYPASVYGLMVTYLRSIRFSLENADEESVRSVAKDWLHDLVYNNPSWPDEERIHELVDAWLHAIRYGSNRLDGNRKTKDDHLGHLIRWLSERPSARRFEREVEVSLKPPYDHDAPLDPSISVSEAQRQLNILARIYGVVDETLPDGRTATRINVKVDAIPNWRAYIRKLEERVRGDS